MANMATRRPIFTFTGDPWQNDQRLFDVLNHASINRERLNQLYPANSRENWNIDDRRPRDANGNPIDDVHSGLPERVGHVYDENGNIIPGRVYMRGDQHYLPADMPPPSASGGTLLIGGGYEDVLKGGIASDRIMPSMASSSPQQAAYIAQQQSGTRHLPLNQRTLDMLNAAGDAAGVEVHVYSGAQVNGPAGQWSAYRGGPTVHTGSVRHNEGVGAADLTLWKDGRMLDENNPADLPIIQTFMASAIQNGATGLGAGEGYMGSGHFHVGFGAGNPAGGPMLWGPGEVSSTTPAWLKQAAIMATDNPIAAAAGGSTMTAAATPWAAGHPVNDPANMAYDAATGQFDIPVSNDAIGAVEATGTGQPVPVAPSFSGDLAKENAARDAAIRTAYAEDTQHPEGPLSVIYNRTQDRRFPADAASVVSQPGQFNGYGNWLYKSLTPDSPLYQQLGAQWDALNAGTAQPVTPAIAFLNPSIAAHQPWQDTMAYQGAIGDHKFYGEVQPRAGAPTMASAPPPTIKPITAADVPANQYGADATIKASMPSYDASGAIIPPTPAAITGSWNNFVNNIGGAKDTKAAQAQVEEYLQRPDVVPFARAAGEEMAWNPALWNAIPETAKVGGGLGVLQSIFTTPPPLRSVVRSSTEDMLTGGHAADQWAKTAPSDAAWSAPTMVPTDTTSDTSTVKPISVSSGGQGEVPQSVTWGSMAKAGQDALQAVNAAEAAPTGSMATTPPAMTYPNLTESMNYALHPPAGVTDMADMSSIAPAPVAAPMAYAPVGGAGVAPRPSIATRPPSVQTITGTPSRQPSFMNRLFGSPGMQSYPGATPVDAGFRSMVASLIGSGSSPFTPAGSNWHSPDFNPHSGGSTYAWTADPNDPGHGSYINSYGQTLHF